MVLYLHDIISCVYNGEEFNLKILLYLYKNDIDNKEFAYK